MTGVEYLVDRETSDEVWDAMDDKGWRAEMDYAWDEIVGKVRGLAMNRMISRIKIALEREDV